MIILFGKLGRYIINKNREKPTNVSKGFPILGCILSMILYNVLPNNTKHNFSDS